MCPLVQIRGNSKQKQKPPLSKFSVQQESPGWKPPWMEAADIGGPLIGTPFNFKPIRHTILLKVLSQTSTHICKLNGKLLIAVLQAFQSFACSSSFEHNRIASEVWEVYKRIKWDSTSQEKKEVIPSIAKDISQSNITYVDSLFINTRIYESHGQKPTQIDLHGYSDRKTPNPQSHKLWTCKVFTEQKRSKALYVN